MLSLDNCTHAGDDKIARSVESKFSVHAMWMRMTQNPIFSKTWSFILAYALRLLWIFQTNFVVCYELISTCVTLLISWWPPECSPEVACDLVACIILFWNVCRKSPTQLKLNNFLPPKTEPPSENVPPSHRGMHSLLSLEPDSHSSNKFKLIY